MKYLGFVLSIIILVTILFFRTKIEARHCKFAGLIFLLSILGFFISLPIFKWADIIPSTKLMIAPMVSIWAFCLLVVFFYLVQIMVQRMIDFQNKIGNKHKGFIKVIVKNQKYIIGFYHFGLSIGLALGLYGLWIAELN